MSTASGQYYEQLAADHLRNSGYSIIESNFRCKHGELDIIAKNKNLLVFVEVKYRKSSQFGTAAEQVGHGKRNKLRKTAEYYLQQYGSDKDCRFDVIAISGAKNSINWIQNAF